MANTTCQTMKLYSEREIDSKPKNLSHFLGRYTISLTRNLRYYSLSFWMSNNRSKNYKLQSILTQLSCCIAENINPSYNTKFRLITLCRKRMLIMVECQMSHHVYYELSIPEEIVYNNLNPNFANNVLDIYQIRPNGDIQFLKRYNATFKSCYQNLGIIAILEHTNDEKKSIVNGKSAIKFYDFMTGELKLEKYFNNPIFINGGIIECANNSSCKSYIYKPHYNHGVYYYDHSNDLGKKALMLNIKPICLDNLVDRQGFINAYKSVKQESTSQIISVDNYIIYWYASQRPEDIDNSKIYNHDHYLGQGICLEVFDSMNNKLVDRFYLDGIKYACLCSYDKESKTGFLIQVARVDHLSYYSIRYKVKSNDLINSNVNTTTTVKLENVRWHAHDSTQVLFLFSKENATLMTQKLYDLTGLPRVVCEIIIDYLTNKSY